MSRTTWNGRRKAVNALMLGITGICCIMSVSVLLFILGYLCWNGARSLSLTFLTSLPKPVGESGGGMVNAIVGSLEIVGLATLIGFPIGFLTAVYLSEYGKGALPSLVRFATDLLNGVPSIVIGVFAYTIVVLPMGHFSAWAGAVALAILVVPIAVRTTEEFLRAVPMNLREAAYALGATQWRAIATVVIPAAMQGIITALMLAVARIAGETAPLLFTSFGNRFWNHSLNEPTATLPVMIFNYALSPYEDWHRQAWGAAFLLLLVILLTNVIAHTVLSAGFGYRGQRG